MARHSAALLQFSSHKNQKQQITLFYFFTIPRYNKYNMLIISIFSLLGLFILNILFGMYYGFGFRHYWFFELEHFLGGFFVAMFLMNFTDSIIFVFTGLAIITFLWELIEYLISRFQKSASYMKKTFAVKNLNPGWEDTVLDLVLGFLGATIFIAIKSQL